MATVSANIQPKEDFPFDSYALLESRLQSLRLLVMKTAARLARSESASGQASSERVTVGRKHVTKALEAVAKKPQVIAQLLSGEATLADSAD